MFVIPHWIPSGVGSFSNILNTMLHGAGIFTYIYTKNDPVL